jgi:hypothetical protein
MFQPGPAARLWWTGKALDQRLRQNSVQEKIDRALDQPLFAAPRRLLNRLVEARAGLCRGLPGEIVDLLPVDNERRRQCNDVAGGAPSTPCSKQRRNASNTRVPGLPDRDSSSMPAMVEITRRSHAELPSGCARHSQNALPYRARDRGFFLVVQPSVASAAARLRMAEYVYAVKELDRTRRRVIDDGVVRISGRAMTPEEGWSHW